MPSNRVFYKEYFAIVLPLILQQFITIMLNIVDNIMVGTLGEQSIVAVGFAGKLFFIFLLTTFGACSGGGILIAQYFGKKDYVMLRKIFFITTIFAISFSIVFTVYGLFFADTFISFFTQDAHIIMLGKEYLRILVISFPFFAFSVSAMVALRSMGFTKVPLYITVVATAVNTFLNYSLIYGNFGFPELQTKGAAIATLVARTIECFCFAFIIFNKKYNLITSLKNYLDISKKTIKSFVKLSLPAFLAELLWSSGTMVLYAAYALLGTKAATALVVSEVLFSVGSVIFVGVSTGASIVIGQKLGAGQTQTAIWITRKIIKLALTLGILISVICFVIINPVLYFYSLEPDTRTLTKITLIATSVIVFIKMFNWVLIVGILRAGGDTFTAFVIDFLPIVLYAIPVAFLLPKFFPVALYTLMIVVNLEEVLKCYITIKRIQSRKWIKNLVH